MVKKRIIEHVIELEWCKGCGICIHFCPKNVLALDKNQKVTVERLEDCIGCVQCELRCPDLAMQVIVKKEETP